ncbi:MAG: RNA 3'-terminal phosphate cyclase [Candidatus Aenigmatarchaeota archaeon]
MILIDGSYLEGGGQIIRTSIALSAITGKPCRITNIRSGRKNPGLQAQHLRGIEAAAKLCGAELKNAKLGSTEVEFFPKKITGGSISIDVGTAGSITLVLQTLVPICLYAEKESILEIIGGTDVSWSPSINYFKNIFLNSLELLGMKREYDFDLDIVRYGFYPKGQGRITFKIRPFRKFNKLNLVERGELERIDIISVASEELKGKNVAERQIVGAEKILNNIERKDAIYEKTMSTGSSIHMHAHFENCKLGASALGEITKRAEIVGEECALNLKRQIDSKACFDEWMADQILPYMALSGESKISIAEITNHCKTNIWVIEKFLPVKFEIRGRIISCSTLP